MSRRFALKSILPLLLLAVAGVGAALMAGPTLDVDAARRSRGGGVETGLPVAQAAQGSNARDTSQWAAASGTVQGVTYSFRYPSGWSAALAYCAPSADSGQRSGHIPPGCASTDFLAGQKALDVGHLIDGTPLTVDGKSALRFVDRKPNNVLVSRTYTVMLYDERGQALFGFTTHVGYDTDPATLNAITEALDGVVATLSVEAGR